MTLYSSSPFAPVTLLQPGKPEYVWGSFNDRVPNTRLQVSNVALTTNVATLTVLVLEGPIPAVGSLITVQGTQSTSGLFNVTNVALTGVTIDATSGAGTLTFALTHADVVSAPNSGGAIVQTPVVMEAVTTATASKPVDQPQAAPALTGFSAEAFFSAAPAAAVVAVQVADRNIDAAYQTVDTLTFTGTQTILRSDQAGLTPLFIRLLLVSHTGAETLAGRILWQ